MGVSQWVQRVWYGGSRWRYPLIPLALLFRGLVSLRRSLYRHGLLARHAVPVPVLVIGNLTVGGTGKTPLVIHVVQLLQQMGARPGVVSRGYAAQARRDPYAVMPQDDPAVCGDEPLLIRRRTQAPVVVGADRVAAARKLSSLGVDVIVSDDGLQHYRLARDAEWVVIDGARGLGNGWCLPAGPLREPVVRLAAAGLLIVNGEGAAFDGAVRMQLHGEAACHLQSGERRSLQAFAGRTVHAVAGIGNPQRFFRFLQAAGLTIVPYALPDHADAQAYRFVDELHATVLMTEKDAVKYTPRRTADCWSVPVDACFSAADEQRLRDRLQHLLRRDGFERRP